MRRAFHLVRPPVVADFAPEVIDSYELYDHFALASELWRLTGHPERAQAIDDAVAGAYDYDVPLLTTGDIRELRELLAGLPDAVVGTIADDQRIIPADQLPELRTRAQRLDVAESRGRDAVFAVQEALIDIDNLDGALRTALEHGAHIVFD